MQSIDAFSGFHPVNNFLYFLVILTVSMFSMNPLYVGISLVGAAVYLLRLKGGEKVLRSLFVILPLMFFTALINPIFNHQGMTILTYLPNGNPLTLESIEYGGFAALMLVAVVAWFSCLTEVMTSDKFIYLFGRIIPSLSLLISMTLRFVPRFTQKFKEVKNAQECLGGTNGEKKSFAQKIKDGLRSFSILITWSMENSIETADSMKSRGYGLPGRTAFSIYTFRKEDKSMLLWILLCSLIFIAGKFSGAIYWRFYPTLKGPEINFSTIFTAGIYLLFSLTPVLCDRYDDIRWSKRDAS